MTVFLSSFTGALILAKDGFISPARTDIDGRFRLPGVGRDASRLVLIEGESVRSHKRSSTRQAIQHTSRWCCLPTTRGSVVRASVRASLSPRRAVLSMA